MSLKQRINKLGGGERCPGCGYPGRLPKEAQVEIRVHVARVDAENRPIYDPETGHVLWDPPIPPPRYCSECGRELNPIQMKGLQNKDVRGWGVPATGATGD
jgi:hypothetical protein